MINHVMIKSEGGLEFKFEKGANVMTINVHDLYSDNTFEDKSKEWKGELNSQEPITFTTLS